MTQFNLQVAKEVLEDFQAKYMKSGFEIISGISRMCAIFTIVGVLLFPSEDNQNYKRILTAYPVMFTFLIIIEKNIETNRFVREYSFVFYQLFTGISVLQGTQ